MGRLEKGGRELGRDEECTVYLYCCLPYGVHHRSKGQNKRDKRDAGVVTVVRKSRVNWEKLVATYHSFSRPSRQGRS